jgi:cytochrome c
MDIALAACLADRVPGRRAGSGNPRGGEGARRTRRRPPARGRTEAGDRDFNDLNGGYSDHNLFVVTYDQQHKVASSARIPAYLGRDATRFVDEDGKEFGKAIITMAETNGAGWVDYRMTNPVTMKVDLKTSYVIKVDGYVVFVGAYKP